jgi:hypothetical protein
MCNLSAVSADGIAAGYPLVTCHNDGPSKKGEATDQASPLDRAGERKAEWIWRLDLGELVRALPHDFRLSIKGGRR